MKKFLVSAATALVASTAMLGGVANAAPPSYERHDNRGDRNDRDFRNGSYNVGGHRYERARGPAWNAPRNWQRHNWQRGQRMPADYRRVVVSDYRNYHLAPPPRGYEYVRDGNDVVMTAIVSGIIGAVIGNVFAN